MYQRKRNARYALLWQLLILLVLAVGAAMFIVALTKPTPTTTGTINTVSLAEPVEFIVSGSPLTGNGGTITVSKATQLANRFWGGPVSGLPAVPVF